jgi:hypothetical protein
MMPTHYELKAETGFLKLDKVDPPEVRVASCESEIAAVLEKYGCILLVNVFAKEPPK